jgi:acyl carrier protein
MKLCRHKILQLYRSDLDKIYDIEEMEISKKAAHTMEKVKERVTQVLHIEKELANDSIDFFEYGGNSIAGVELVAKLQREFQVNLPMTRCKF